MMTVWGMLMNKGLHLIVFTLSGSCLDFFFLSEKYYQNGWEWHAVCSPGQSVSLVNPIVQLTSYPETIEEEGSEVGSPGEEDPLDSPAVGLEVPHSSSKEKPPSGGTVEAPAPKSEDKDAMEIQKRRRLEQAGIKVMAAAQRFARLALLASGWPGWPACPRIWNLCYSELLMGYFPLPACPLHYSSLLWTQINRHSSLPEGMFLAGVLGYLKWGRVWARSCLTRI
jgi:hypothetical protein